MNTQRGSFWVGTSGYQYAHWRGVFYPAHLPQKEWFEYYARCFDTVEINYTFYHLPDTDVFDNWRRRAPEGFCYALKFSRYSTHLKKLKEPEDAIGAFVERADRLDSLLGPILLQLPPRWNVNLDRLARFLEAAPSDYRWTVEFRDPRWLCAGIYRILRDHNVALCIHDRIENHPPEITTDWTYLRFHGVDYGGTYSSQVLRTRAQQIRGYLADGMDAYAYFNNDLDGYAVSNALELRRYVLSG